jgi:inhibitor of the pro-sigma K processing machinery
LGKSCGEDMEKIILAIITVACLIFIAICVIRKRADLVIDFLLRACVGTAGIYLLDFVLGISGYQISVGINTFSILSNGLLGLPGFILLYGLAFYYSL